jgi:glutaminase
MAAKVFISYRREDSAGYAGRILDRLEREFERDLLFIDVDSIPLGLNFVKVLSEEVAKCGVLLAVIGHDWLDTRDEDGSRRLNNPNDFVRIEIATALRRDIPVIPILLDGTSVPRANQLPEDLRELALRNGLNVHHASFHADMDKLVRELKRQAAEARLKAEEEQAAETLRKAEQERQAAEAQRKAEQERQAAEAQRKAEQERKAAEAQRKAEQEQQAAEAQRKAEEERQAAEAQRKAEEERQAAEAQRKAEEERQAAEAQRKAEEERQAAEARRRAEEEQQAAEARRKAEEEQQAAEARRRAEEEQQAEARLGTEQEWQTKKWRQKQDQAPAPVTRKELEKAEKPRKRYLIFAISAVTTLSLVLVVAWILLNHVRTPPTAENGKPLMVAGNSTATPMGIPAPSDANYPPALLRITVTDLPSNGKIVLTDGITTITTGETLTVDQLTGLRFVPTPGVFDQSSTFAYSVGNPAGLTTAGSVILTIHPNMMRPTVANGPPLTVAGSSSSNPMSIPAPSDPNYPPAQLRITAVDLPSNGKVMRADGTTEITTGETLTVDQLTGLRFAPTPGIFDQSSTFAYRVENPAGLTTMGAVTLTIHPNMTRPTVVDGPPLTVTGSSSSTPMSIPAPSDPNYPPAQLRIAAVDLPSNGKVMRADGTTAITTGETLTVDQLTRLRFVPTFGVFDQSSTFAYSVENPAGLTTVGSVTLTIGPAPPFAPKPEAPPSTKTRTTQGRASVKGNGIHPPPSEPLSRRCATIIERIQLGQEISDVDRATLKSDCR